MPNSTPEWVPTTPPAAPTRRGRPPKPSAKVLEAQQTLQERSVITRASRNVSTPTLRTTDTPVHATATLDTITTLILELKNTVTQQGIAIEEIRAEQQAEREAHKIQYADLQEEVRLMRAQLNAYSLSLPSTQSWASVAAGQGTPDTGTSLSRQASNGNPYKELNCLRISTQPTPENSDPNSNINTLTRYLSIENANNQIRTALLLGDATREVQIAGVGTTKTGYIIRFKDQQSAETAKEHTEWLQELGNGTKLVKPRFGVVVHRAPTEDFHLPEGKEDGIKKLMIENDLEAEGHQIDDIAWLKNKDKPLGRSASLGIWLDSEEAAEKIINNGIIIGQRYIGSIEPYQMRKKRCHKCQNIGHLAWSCKEKRRCGHCTGEHDRWECPPDTTARCADCGLPHPTNDRECKGSKTASTRL